MPLTAISTSPPLLGTDSTAFAGGAPFGFAAVFGHMLHAMATGGNFLVDVLP